jgi:diguanylate cyclase (GGDEF)-like protein
MNLRNKILLFAGVALALVLVATTLITRIYYLRNYLAIENSVVQQDIDRVRQALIEMSRNLSMTTGDWAAWDDTYQFVQDRNPEYIAANIYPETFQSLDLDFMLFLDLKGQVVYSEGYDPDTGMTQAIPSDLTDFISQSGMFTGPLASTSDINGFIRIGEKVLVVAARPILKNMMVGPVMGTLVFARFLDQDEVDQLAETTQLSVNAIPLGSEQIAADIQSTLRTSHTPYPSLIHPASDDMVSGILLMRDISGSPAFFIQIDEVRTIYLQGLRSVNLILFFVLITGLVSAGVVYVSVEGIVVARLKRIIGTIISMHKESDWSLRVAEKGKDELGNLSREINSMLDIRQKLDSKIRRMARTDGLTGLLNRRSMDEVGMYEINRARRKQLPLSVMMIDMDNFKQVNDRNNHLVGDQVLKGVAKLLRSRIRNIDYLCRYGGDEFAILMPDTNSKQATIVAERLRSCLFDNLLLSDAGPQHLTASIGIASTFAGAEGLLTLYRQADEAMYTAKNKGRNRITIFEMEKGKKGK